jgi:energy-coupling factor transporter ATP-binding protein EcfA2
VAVPADSRLAAFCAAPQLWRSVAQVHDIWRPDPFDVAEIHAEARQAFSRLVETAEPSPPGRILLLLGESGAGKTHLMRAFRNQVHARGQGQVAYMQMTSAIEDYPRYLLHKTIASLEKPYLADDPAYSGLARLSDALIERAGAFPRKALETYRQGRFSPQTLRQATDLLATRILEKPLFAELPLDLLRAMITLQRPDPRYRGLAAQWLRGAAWSGEDRAALGVAALEPEALLEGLARLIRLAQRGPLVLCLDQLENVYDLSAAESQFRRAVGSLAALADQVPGLVLVIACLSDLYGQFKNRLTRSFVDRLERDPRPVTLRAGCDAAQVRELLARRLQTLYPGPSLYPFPDDIARQLAGQRLRDVLYTCGEWQAYFSAHGQPPERLEMLLGEDTPPPAPGGPSLSQAWNDFQVTFTGPLPQDPPEMLRLLAESLNLAAAERGLPLALRSDPAHTSLALDSPGIPPLLLGLCQKSPNWLSRQIEALRKQAGKRIPVALRVGGFPHGAATLRVLAKLEQDGGWWAGLETDEWRILSAWRAFHGEYGGQPDFTAWQREEQVLSRLPTFLRLLDQPG